MLSETLSVRAIVGISGAPRLLTMATSAATVTRVGMVDRSRHVRLWATMAESGAFPVVTASIPSRCPQSMTSINDTMPAFDRCSPERAGSTHLRGWRYHSVVVSSEACERLPGGGAHSWSVPPD